jgi:SNF2 family DNA or RNA helicase
MASGSKTAAAQTMHHPASLPAAGGEGGAIMSCKLRAVIDYLNDLRTRSGGVRPSEALRRAASGAQLAAASGGGGTGSSLNKKERVRERNQTLRDGIRSSDAALAAALPPLPPVSFTSSRAIGTAALVGGSVASAVAEPPEKVIVFSQWTGTLDLLEPALRAEGFDFRRLDGTMSLAAREKALLEFETCPGVSVMLMSLKAAGLGVNLVCANHVLLLDVWWNPTVEEQAIDRSHRIGQRRPVHVCRLTVADTVEARILALQEHKRALAAAAFGEAHAGGAHGAGATGEEGGTSAADAAADAHRSRLTVEDLLFLFD